MSSKERRSPPHLGVGERGREQLQRVGQANGRPAGHQLHRPARLPRVAPVHTAQHLRAQNSMCYFQQLVRLRCDDAYVADAGATGSVQRCAVVTQWGKCVSSRGFSLLQGYNRHDASSQQVRGTFVRARGSAVRLLRKRQISARSSALSTLRAAACLRSCSARHLFKHNTLSTKWLGSWQVKHSSYMYNH